MDSPTSEDTNFGDRNLNPSTVMVPNLSMVGCIRFASNPIKVLFKDKKLC